jgi:hypothetical protein
MDILPHPGHQQQFKVSKFHVKMRHGTGNI